LRQLLKLLFSTIAPTLVLFTAPTLGTAIGIYFARSINKMFNKSCFLTMTLFLRHS